MNMCVVFKGDNSSPEINEIEGQGGMDMEIVQQQEHIPITYCETWC